jgi:hypothetical protein
MVTGPILQSTRYLCTVGHYSLLTLLFVCGLRHELFLICTASVISKVPNNHDFQTGRRISQKLLTFGDAVGLLWELALLCRLCTLECVVVGRQCTSVGHIAWFLDCGLDGITVTSRIAVQCEVGRAARPRKKRTNRLCFDHWVRHNHSCFYRWP